MTKLGWCMTNHHAKCPKRTISGIGCACGCHADKHNIITALFGANTTKDEGQMAQKVIMTLEDDLDGSEASETVVFGLDGKTYEIDLNDKNAAKLRKALAPYTDKGRKLKGSTATRTPRASSSDDTAAIRSWARDNGYEVNDRGRVPGNIREAYQKAKAA